MAIASIAVELRRNPGLSLAARIEALVKHGAGVSEAELEGVFASRSDLLQAWLSYSEDQRTSDGWYFTRSEAAGAWEVGQLRGRKREVFSNPAAACAAFVARIVGEPAAIWTQHES